jgi:putative FmdB family regulatory protein
VPIYEFICTECRKSFELELSMAGYAKRKSFKCPKCESSRHVQRKVTSFFAVTSKKS